jgi:HEAT repeat protein
VRISRAKANTDITALVGALDDPEHASAAARALAKLSGAVTHERSAAIRGLRRLLKAPDPHSRASAAEALGALKAREGFEELRNLAHEDAVDWVRSWAVGALGRTGGESSYPLILGFLDDPSRKVRSAAAIALRTVGDQRDVPALTRAMSRERWFLRAPFRDAIRDLKNVDG